jgi:hypothetical protein
MACLTFASFSGTFGLPGGEKPGIGAYPPSFMKLRLDPADPIGCSGNAFPEEGNPRSFQLLLRLEKITGVRPEAGVSQTDYHAAGGAGETAYP